jgi:hypothetical protein
VLGLGLELVLGPEKFVRREEVVGLEAELGADDSGLEAAAGQRRTL